MFYNNFCSSAINLYILLIERIWPKFEIFVKIHPGVKFHIHQNTLVQLLRHQPLQRLLQLLRLNHAMKKALTICLSVQAIVVKMAYPA